MKKHLNPLNSVTVETIYKFSSCLFDWCAGLDGGCSDSTNSSNYCLFNDRCNPEDKSGCNLTFDMCICLDSKAGGGADFGECGRTDIEGDYFPPCRTVNGTGINDASFCGPWNVQVDDVMPTIEE